MRYENIWGIGTNSSVIGHEVKWQLLSHVWLFRTPVGCSLPCSSVHGILQARILEWVAYPSSRGSFQPGDQTRVSCITGRFFLPAELHSNTISDNHIKHTQFQVYILFSSPAIKFFFLSYYSFLIFTKELCAFPLQFSQNNMEEGKNMLIRSSNIYIFKSC